MALDLYGQAFPDQLHRAIPHLFDPLLWSRLLRAIDAITTGDMGARYLRRAVGMLHPMAEVLSTRAFGACMAEVQ